MKVIDNTYMWIGSHIMSWEVRLLNHGFTRPLGRQCREVGLNFFPIGLLSVTLGEVSLLEPVASLRLELG